MASPRHHLIPQFFLKRFANEQDQLILVDGKSGKAHTTHVKNAAVEAGFYTIETDEGPSQEVEAFLSSVESATAQALTLLDEGTWPLLGEARGALATFIALQLVRGRDFRFAVNDFELSVMKKAMQLEALNPDSVRQRLKEATGSDPSDAELEFTLEVMREGRFDIRDRGSTIVAGIEASQDLAKLAFVKRWRLLEGDEMALLIGDVPVTMWADPKRHPTSVRAVGLGTADEVILPLDPWKCLLLSPPNDFTPGADDLRSSIGAEGAAKINLRTVATAQRFIFHHPAMISPSD
jgi:hypothetical protein